MPLSPATNAFKGILAILKQRHDGYKSLCCAAPFDPALEVGGLAPSHLTLMCVRAPFARVVTCMQMQRGMNTVWRIRRNTAGTDFVRVDDANVGCRCLLAWLSAQMRKSAELTSEVNDDLQQCNITAGLKASVTYNGCSNINRWPQSIRCKLLDFLYRDLQHSTAPSFHIHFHLWQHLEGVSQILVQCKVALNSLSGFNYANQI